MSCHSRNRRKALPERSRLAVGRAKCLSHCVAPQGPFRSFELSYQAGCIVDYIVSEASIASMMVSRDICWRRCA